MGWQHLTFLIFYYPNIYIDVILRLNMADKTFMRVDKELLKKLKAKKLARRESYADVVKRMIDKEVRGKK